MKIKQFDVVFKDESKDGFRLCGHVEEINSSGDVTIRWNHYRVGTKFIVHGGTLKYLNGEEVNRFLERFEIISGIESVRKAEA